MTLLDIILLNSLLKIDESLQDEKSCNEEPIIITHGDPQKNEALNHIEASNGFAELTVSDLKKYFRIFRKENSYPEIRLHTDGKETVCEMVRDGKVVKTTSALCHPDDKFNLYSGMSLALARMFAEKQD